MGRGRKLSLLCYLNFSISSLISDPCFTLSPAAPLSINSGQQAVHSVVSLALPRHVLFLLPNYFFENCIKITYPLVSLLFFVVMCLYLLFPLPFHFSVVSEKEDKYVQLICRVWPESLSLSFWIYIRHFSECVDTVDNWLEFGGRWSVGFLKISPCYQHQKTQCLM